MWMWVLIFVLIVAVIGAGAAVAMKGGNSEFMEEKEYGMFEWSDLFENLKFLKNFILLFYNFTIFLNFFIKI